MSSSSGGKGGSSSKQKNYYGTIAGAICWGPLDWVSAIIFNGNYLWQGNLTLTSDVTDFTGSLLDPTLVAPGGYLKLYRGTETQPADPSLTGTPTDRGTVKLVGKHLFFGQGSGSAPNIQIIGGRLPRVPTTIVAAASNIADDGQVNPIAAYAEFLLDERGGGIAASQFDAPSWLAAAAWCAQDQDHRDYTFCSPLITEQVAIRDINKRLLGPFNGYVRWNPAGLLTCNIYEWGVDPGNLPTLDAQVWTKKPQFTLGDWVDVPTELLVSFTDRAYEFQDNSVLVPNARAAQIRQVDDQRRIERPDVMRATQAHRHAAEMNRRLGNPAANAPIDVREPFVRSIRVGDKVKVDTDPEPGGSGLAQLCQVVKIEQDCTDEATITVTTDNLLPATLYKPSYPALTPVTQVSPPMVNFMALPLPPVSFGWPLAVGILATRPSAAVVGMEVFFSDAHANAFDAIGQQVGFAVRAQLSGAIGTGDTTLSLMEIDGLTAPDANIAVNTPGGNLTTAKNNALLAVFVQLDGNGRVALDSGGNPIMEFASIIDRTFVSGATFSYSVLRGRLDTPALAWANGAAVWIVPSSSLEAWRPELLGFLCGSPAFLRLVSYTSAASDETTPAPECSVNVLPTSSDMYQRGLASTGADDGIKPDPVTAFSATAGPGMITLKWTPPSNTPIALTRIYESTTTTRPNGPVLAVTAPQAYCFRSGLDDGVTLQYWFEVLGKNGRTSVIVGPYAATAGTQVPQVVTDALNGISNTLARSLQDSADHAEAITQEITDRSTTDSALLQSIQQQATDFIALVSQTKTDTLAAAAGDASSKDTAVATTAANATAALATRTSTLESTVNNATTGLAATVARVGTVETNYASADAALATRATNLETTVNNGTTGLAATRSSLATTQAVVGDANSGLVKNQTTLSNQVNDANTGLAKTKQIADTVTTVVGDANSGLVKTTNTLSAQINTPTTGIAAALAAVQTTASATATALSTETTNRTTAESVINTALGQKAAQSIVDSLSSTLTTSLASFAQTIANVIAQQGDVSGSVQTLADAYVDAAGKAITRWGVQLTAGSDGNMVQTGIEAVAQNGKDPISAIRMLANIFQLRSTINGTDVSPFIVDNGVVYMNTAMIGSATITDAMIAALTVDKLQGGTITGKNINVTGGGRILFDNGSVWNVIGTGFGSANQFVEWFGPTQSSISLCTEANAISYKKIDGSAYFGGSLSAGRLFNSISTSDLSATAQVILGPFGTNGNQKAVVLSYNVTVDVASVIATNGQAATASVQLWRSINGGAETLVTTLSATGAWAVYTVPGEQDSRLHLGGSVTFTDTDTSTYNRTYRAVITARNPSSLPTQGGTQRITITSTE